MAAEALALEDDIDLDTFQAQIDASLAHTLALVESWIPPSSKRTNGPQITLAEFESTLHRPPRLGVGAALPDSAGASYKETARLRGRILGGKRNRETEDQPVSLIRAPSDDEGIAESRASAIKKKARVDPFAPKKPKKGKQDFAQVEVPSMKPPRSMEFDKEDVADKMPSASTSVDANYQLHDDVEPSQKRKKRKKMKTAGNSVEDTAIQAESLSSEAKELIPKVPSPGRFVRAPKDPSSSPELPIDQLSIPIPPSPSPTPVPTSPLPSLDSSATSPVASHRALVDMLGLIRTPSLLNIHGPPAVVDTAPAVNDKKRRRRKKGKKAPETT